MNNIRLGLCCVFADAPIKFKVTTASAVSRLTREAALEKLSALCSHNARSLLEALRFCSENGIGCFRVLSQIVPLATHPHHGYGLNELPDGGGIIEEFTKCREYASVAGIRLCFHPDQFVVLNSPRPEVLLSSIAELEHHATLAKLVGADVINIHGGGVYGDKDRALGALVEGISLLSKDARSLLTLENDDVSYTLADLLPVCRSIGIPLVYDVHHHRCLPDGLSIHEATHAAAETWNREQLVHVSSPAGGWECSDPKKHHDYINPSDFPDEWMAMRLTAEVEARAKEKAVLQLKRDLEMRQAAY